MEVIPIKYEMLIGQIAAVKKVKKLTYADMGKLTGYKPNTISQFMNGIKQSDKLADALAAALGIER